MNLAVICRPFSFYGGVETATAGLLAELVRHGHAVDLLSTREQGDVPGVRVRRLPVVPQPSLLRVLSFALVARRAGRQGRYDIVQSHERALAQDIYRAGEGTHRGYLQAVGQGLARVNPHHRLVCALERRIFQLESARHIVAISAQGKEEIQRLYGTPPERVTVVYNGVDLARFHPDNRARLGPEARKALGLAPEDWVVVFVGSGFERKGLGPLLEAMARLGDRGSRLVVAGKGRAEPYRAVASRLALGTRVVWAGPRQDVEHLYAAADVVALPARYEPFGNVHLEALASGVPVLTSARAGGSEVVTSGVNGWVVSEPSVDTIRLGLEALRDQGRGALAAAARKTAEPYTYAAQVWAFTSLYRQLAR